MANKFRLQFEDGTTKSVNATIKPPKDVIQFVAGTTDPINTTGLKHQANKDYWRGTDNLWQSVKDLKPQFLDLHIEDSFFSWSGDNNTNDRKEAANRLLDLLLRVYSNWTNKEVHLHLIGHSHGGNVINQFTEIIATNESFPKYWKVKSITYLSTPFFKEQHQLNHSKLHPECKIINVHNQYDITQRFIADFTLKNLEYLIGNFKDKDKMDAAIDTIKTIDLSAYEHLSDFVINNDEEGPAIWDTTHKILAEAETIIKVIADNVAFIGNRNIVSPEKKEFLVIVNTLHTLITERKTTFNKNKKNRDGGYGRAEFLEDLELVPLLTVFNKVLSIKVNESDSYLLSLLVNIFTEKDNGLLLKIDDTSWSPEQQVNGSFTIEDFDITEMDPYHKSKNKSNFEPFAKGIEDAMKRNDENSLKEILMRLSSQFIIPKDLEKIINGMDWLEYAVFGDLDTQIKEMRKNLTIYHKLIKKYNANLISQDDINNTSLKVKPGSIPYLAMNAHSLSHSALFDDSKLNVREALTSSFSSGSNPGYK